MWTMTFEDIYNGNLPRVTSIQSKTKNSHALGFDSQVSNVLCPDLQSAHAKVILQARMQANNELLPGYLK